MATEPITERRERLERVYARLQSVGIVNAESLHRENGRYLVRPSHASDRYLTLSEAEEWTMGAVATLEFLCSIRAVQEFDINSLSDADWARIQQTGG